MAKSKKYLSDDPEKRRHQIDNLNRLGSKKYDLLLF